MMDTQTYILFQFRTSGYSNADPGPAFARLDRIIRDLLEIVISTRSFSIATTEVKPSYHLGRIDSQKIDEKTTFHLGISSSVPAAELVGAVPLRFKIGAPDAVEKFVLSAMPGIRIVHETQVPGCQRCGPITSPSGRAGRCMLLRCSHNRS